MSTTISTAPAPASEVPGGTRPPAVLAVVVTHGGRRWLKECLVSLNTQTYAQLDVLVVDDASPDSRDAPQLRRVVKRHSTRRRWGYLRTPRPLGFGGAVNWALSRVRTDAELLLFIHDDAALDPDAVEHMVARTLADDSTAVVGPKIVSWDDPLGLEEVGMAVDRFGYPYKGLEKGEIDLGQYDNSFEVFYVTSTCMLVRHEVFRSLRGWDSQMRAFSEDLDLCWRARVMGHTVRVEPKAKARHAIALATGQRSSQFTPTRYYIRRNRLRTVAKNVSTARLFWLIPQFVLLAIAEMVGFIVLRQYGEIVNIARALGWNLLRLPQTLAARVRVQRTRTVPDRRLSRLTVKEGTRVRAYAGHQTERLEAAWGRRAELMAARTGHVRAARRRVTTLPLVVAGLLVLALLVGFRNYLWSGEASVGTLLPYPDSPFALVRAYLSPWRETGLGQPWPPSPGLLFLGAFPMLALGAVGMAQKLLLLVLGAAAFVGAYRLVADLVGRPGRWVAGAVYLFGVVGLAGVRAGALGALVFGAAAPYVLRSLLHTTGWIRPARYDAGAEIARIAIGTAAAAAFVPGAVFVFAGAGMLLAAGRALLSASSPTTGLGAAAAGTLLGWALLLPWSWTWFAAGGPLNELAGGDGAAARALAFNEAGMLERLFGASPETPLLMTLAPVVLGVVAVGVGLGQRRRIALALWLLVACSGLFASAGARGLVPAVLGSPVEAAVFPAVCLAALAGIAVGAMRLDLPRRGLGLWQPLAFGGAALAAALFAAGILPAVYHGEWEPGRGTRQVAGAALDQVHAVLAAEAEENGAFRTLWLGDTWRGGGAPGSESARGPLVTGAEGRSLADLFQSDAGPAMIALERTLSAVAGGATDGAGRLLAAFNVRYVVLERAPGVARWLEQTDLGVARIERDYLLLENQSALPRGAVYDRLPNAAIDPGDAATASTAQSAALVTASRRAASAYEAEYARGPGAVFLGESRHHGWRARVGSAELDRARAASWGNAFSVPASAEGAVEVVFERPLGDLAWLLGALIAWLAVLGAALSRRRSNLVARPTVRGSA